MTEARQYLPLMSLFEYWFLHRVSKNGLHNQRIHPRRLRLHTEDIRCHSRQRYCFFCGQLSQNLFRKKVSVFAWNIFFSEGIFFVPFASGVYLFQLNEFKFVSVFSLLFFVQPLWIDRIIIKNGIYCPMSCTSLCNTTFIFSAAIDSATFFVILKPEAKEHLFCLCFLPSDSFLENRIKVFPARVPPKMLPELLTA